MDGQAVELFACPQCGAKFSYRPPPGRDVLCTCGHTFLPDQNIYAVVEEKRAAARRVTVVAQPQVQTVAMPAPPRADSEMGQTLSSAAELYVRRPRRKAVVVDEIKPSNLRDVVLPIVLLAGGVIIWTSRVLAVPPVGLGRGQALALALCQMIVTIALALVGGVLSLGFVETETGPIGRAVLKMTAVATFAAAGTVFTFSLGTGPITDGIVAVNLLLLLYVIFLRILFRLDLQETLLTSVLILALQIGGAFLLLKR